MRRSFDESLLAAQDFVALYAKVFPAAPPPSSYALFAFDAVLIAAAAIGQIDKTVASETATLAAAASSSAASVSSFGDKMLHYIRAQPWAGVTGPLRFAPLQNDRFGQQNAWLVAQLRVLNASSVSSATTLRYASARG